jgi:hypothetical protein
MARVDGAMVTSGLELPGYRIVRNFESCAGSFVRGARRKLGAALQTIIGVTSRFSPTSRKPAKTLLTLLTRSRARQTPSSACAMTPQK